MKYFLRNTDSNRPEGVLCFDLSTVTDCFTLVFAFWTLATNTAVVAHLSFQTLSRIGPFVVVAAVICCLLIARPPAHFEQRNPAQAQLSNWKWLVAAIAIIALRPLGYPLFWVAAFFFLVVSAAKLREGHVPSEKVPTSFSRSTAIVLISLALVSAALVYVAHRPDSDDANFVGFAADAIAHPELPALSHDVLYGGHELPLILPTYAVDSYELFSALLAHWLGGAPIWWAHAVVPTVIAAVLPFAWARLMRSMIPSHWVVATVLTLILLALLGEAHHSVGNLAFVRLFQGKAVLASIGIPLLYAYAWQFADSGAFRDWVMLAFCAIACVGFSAAALFVVPMALGTAALAGLPSKKLVVLGFAPALYPLVWGLALRGSFKAVAPVFDSVSRTAAGTVLEGFGAHAQYVLLAALLAGPFLARPPRLQFRLALIALIFFLVALNPFLFKFIARLTTPESVWRILWSVPIAGIAAVAMVNAVEQASQTWGKRWGVIAGFIVVGVLAWLAPHSSLRKSNRVSFSLSPIKVPRKDWQTARTAIALTPPATTLLAPESVADWVPTFVVRPPLVSVRQVYDDQMAVRMSSEEAKTRRELRELVSGGDFSPKRTEELLATLPLYRVGLIVATPAAAFHLRDALIVRKYMLLPQPDDYIFFVSSAEVRANTIRDRAAICRTTRFSEGLQYRRNNTEDRIHPMRLQFHLLQAFLLHNIVECDVCGFLRGSLVKRSLDPANVLAEFGLPNPGKAHPDPSLIYW